MISAAIRQSPSSAKLPCESANPYKSCEREIIIRCCNGMRFIKGYN